MAFRILCVGEILFDVYPQYKRLGGAPFNFAYHLHQFGEQVAFLSRIGGDSDGREIQEFLIEQSFPVRLLQIDSAHPTGTVEVTLDKKGIPNFIINENVAYDFISLNDDINEYLVQGVDLIYFGTLAQRNAVSRRSIQEILQSAPQKTLNFYDMNLRQSFYDREILQHSLKHSDIVKLNEDEFLLVNKMFGFSGTEDRSAADLMQKFDIEYLCITKGASGSTLFMDDKKVNWKNTDNEDLDIIDTVGAGDSFAAAFANGILKNWDGEKIIERASNFAAAVCTISGAIPESRGFYQQYAAELIESD